MQTRDHSNDVEYFAIEGAPGQFFHCRPYSARLSTTACARRWREAQRATGQEAFRFEKCRGCPIGAAHAGEKLVQYSSLFGSDICPRCGVGSGRRLIGGSRCISCYNREREFIRGKNAKGRRPVNIQRLDRRSIRYAVNGDRIRVLTVEHSADTTELMITALRKTRGQIRFGMYGRHMLRQGRLF